MAIEFKSEKLITFRQLIQSLPKRDGRSVHISTIHRWRSRGSKGVRLEAIRVGGSWMTSHEAFQRFCDHLTALATEPVPPTRMHRGAHKSADEKLQKDGW
jgi:hypothetical protein